MLEDVLVALAALLSHAARGRPPLLGSLGGARLVAPLLGRPQPALRMLGLRLLAICLRRGPAPGGPGAAPGSPSAGGGGGGGAAAAEGLWAAVGDALAAFPLTAHTREALLLLACAGSPAGQCAPSPPHAPRSSLQGPGQRLLWVRGLLRHDACTWTQRGVHGQGERLGGRKLRLPGLSARQRALPASWCLVAGY